METVEVTKIMPNEPAEKFVLEARAVLTVARSLRVEDADDYEFAGSYIATWKEQIAARVAWFKPIKQAMDASKKVVLDKEKEAISPLQQAIDIVGPRAIAWKQEEERKAEAKRREEEDASRKREEEARRVEVERLKAAGEKQQAKLLAKEPIEVPHIPLEPAAPKLSGLGTQKRWDFEIMDPKQVKSLYLVPDETKIRKQVTAIGKDAETLVGGIRVFEVESFRKERG